jgi:hypothetical protein
MLQLALKDDQQTIHKKKYLEGNGNDLIWVTIMAFSWIILKGEQLENDCLKYQERG